MRKMQRREQGWFVAGIQRRHEAVEYSERRAYRSLISLGLSLVRSLSVCAAPALSCRGSRSFRPLHAIFSIWTTIIFALQIAFQLRRIHNEEAVLTEILPEYAAYKIRLPV